LRSRVSSVIIAHDEQVDQNNLPNGQIKLPPEVQLPDNTYVTVILPDDLPEDAAPDPAFSIPDLAQDIGPEDLSRNLEHYLYGHAKQ
jgi:hypothetical protein